MPSVACQASVTFSVTPLYAAIYIYIYIYIYTIPGRQLLYMPSSMDTWAVASTKRPDMLRIRRQRSLITKCQGTHACVAAVR